MDLGEHALMVIIASHLPLRLAALTQLVGDIARRRNMDTLILKDAEGQLLLDDMRTQICVLDAGATVRSDPAYHLLRSIVSLPCAPPVLVICDATDPQEMRLAFDIGARGYLPTASDLALLESVFDFMRAGGTYIPPEMLSISDPVQIGATDSLAAPTLPAVSNDIEPEQFDNSSSEKMNTSPTDPTASPDPIASNAAVEEGRRVSLTTRQNEVLMLLKSGKSNKQIAREIDKSEATVKAHVRQITKKLGVSNRTEAALIAQRAETSADLSKNRSGNHFDYSARKVLHRSRHFHGLRSSQQSS